MFSNKLSWCPKVASGSRRPLDSTLPQPTFWRQRRTIRITSCVTCFLEPITGPLCGESRRSVDGAGVTPVTACHEIYLRRSSLSNAAVLVGESHRLVRSWYSMRLNLRRVATHCVNIIDYVRAASAGAVVRLIQRGDQEILEFLSLLLQIGRDAVSYLKDEKRCEFYTLKR